ncbi:diguanylate cyclase [Curvibacter sp. APW13]|uniref:diguanylate cyclase domain-containing protein n=1 Tax=Curvibacter sp. APW13 TaxID=3077236 RepID=UPI0028DD7F50|nr:diguanylate cyclase [Curvibacter sp. APW13]MDT8989823.1 diguanylate cyclase [Curvibacter sp. APW13]
MFLPRFFSDPDEIAWLREHKSLARYIVVGAAALFLSYALVDNYITPYSFERTWLWRLLGALMCLSTLWSLEESRLSRWAIAHFTLASSSVIAIVCLIFLQLLRQPAIALASLMQCFMLMAMLGPLRSLTWAGSLVAALAFNAGLYAANADLQTVVLHNVFIVFGVSVLLSTSHAAHRNYRQQRSLQQLAQDQARIVEHASDAIIACDSRGRVTSWNHGATQIFGYGVAGAMGKPLDMLFSPGSHTLDSQRLRQTLKGETTEPFQSRWLDALAREIDVTVTMSPLEASNAYAAGVSVIAQDITLLLHAERRLREKDSQFRTAIETSREGFWAADQHGRLIDVNQAYCRMSGYARAELLTMHIEALEAAENPEETRQHIETVMRKGYDSFETQHRRADGSVWPAEVNVNYTDLNGGRFYVFIRDLTERKRVEALAWRQANFDLLTQLPNRALLFDRLEKACAQASRQSQNVALLFADLDGFKQVNDQHGHAAGDAVLQEVAQRWETCVRSADTLARLGGDEFAVVLGGGIDHDSAATTAQKLIDVLRAPIVLPNGAVATVGASIGIATFPLDARSMDALLSRADAAMYTSKRKGKNTYSFADQPPVAAQA